MTKQIIITHTNRYVFDRPVKSGPRFIRLFPATFGKLAASTSIIPDPKADFTFEFFDEFNNRVLQLVYCHQVTGFGFTATTTATCIPVNPFDFMLTPDAGNWPFVYPQTRRAALAPFLQKPRKTKALDKFMARVNNQISRTDDTVDMLVAVNNIVHDAITYCQRHDQGIQSPAHTIGCGSGSCRDIAWLGCAVFRSLGLAARFVSGYLAELARDKPDADTRDIYNNVAYHAWLDVFLPGAGWVGLDPTSGVLAGDGYIPLAAGAKPEQTAAVSGTVEPCGETLEHRLEIHELITDC